MHGGVVWIDGRHGRSAVFEPVLCENSIFRSVRVESGVAIIDMFHTCICLLHSDKYSMNIAGQYT